MVQMTAWGLCARVCSYSPSARVAAAAALCSTNELLRSNDAQAQAQRACRIFHSTNLLHARRQNPGIYMQLGRIDSILPAGN